MRQIMPMSRNLIVAMTCAAISTLGLMATRVDAQEPTQLGAPIPSELLQGFSSLRNSQQVPVAGSPSVSITNYDRIRQLHTSGSRPAFATNAVRAGRCTSVGDTRIVGVFGAFYKKGSETYAILMARQLPDGSFNPAEDDLNRQDGWGQDIEELQPTIGSIVMSPDLMYYRLVGDTDESFTVNRANNRFAYRSSAENMITLKIDRADGKVEYCEFGRILL